MRPPVGYAAVTTPCVVTVFPTYGEVSPVPWICAIASTDGSSGSGSPSPSDFCGVGEPTVKSAALSAVLPCSADRDADVVADRLLVGPVPAKSLVAAPYPTKSTTASIVAQRVALVQPSAVVDDDRATLPAAAPMAIVPLRSVSMSACVPAPVAWPTRKKSCGWIVPDSAVTRPPFPTVPVDDPYWIDHPARLTGSSLTLYSSTKSRRIGAPLLPPPP